MDHYLNRETKAESECLANNLRYLMQSNEISECNLSRKTDIPQPTIHKILSGKTINPRASTLKSLADFFEISIDELISSAPIIKLQDTTISAQSVPLISWSDCISARTSIKELTSVTNVTYVITDFISGSTYALISKPSMEPRFQKGTILIINPEATPKDGDFVIAHYPNTYEATLRELSSDGPLKLLLPVCINGIPNKLDEDIKILGVVVKSIFSFR